MADGYNTKQIEPWVFPWRFIFPSFFPLQEGFYKNFFFPPPPPPSILKLGICCLAWAGLPPAGAAPVPDDFVLRMNAVSPGEPEFVPEPEAVVPPEVLEPAAGRPAFDATLGLPKEHLMSYNSYPGDLSTPAGDGVDRLIKDAPVPSVMVEPDFVTLSATSTTNITHDTRQDAETTVTSVDISGKTYVTTAFYKFNSSTDIKIHYRTSDGTTAWTGVLPLPSGYNQASYDPYLGVNPYSNGVFPRTVYLVGNARKDSNNVAVVGWRSQDGGRHWQGPVIIATGDGDVDKPHIAVSWHSGTRGWIYVGYRDSNGKLVVKRSQNGGGSFTGPYTITSLHPFEINGLQLVVSPYSGYVYALWTDFSADRIYWAYSTNHGVSWTAPAVFPNTSTPAHYLVFRHLKELDRAPSFPIARLNWAAGNGSGRISVVWHECNTPPVGNKKDCDGNGQQTDVYYASLWLNGSTNKTMLNDDNGSNDQFMPALDFDANGNLLVTFYDRRDDINNVDYRLYRTRIDENGQALQSNAKVSNFASTPDDKWTRAKFIGDYHETWMTPVNGIDTWYSSWTGEANNNADIFLSTIQP